MPVCSLCRVPPTEGPKPLTNPLFLSVPHTFPEVLDLGDERSYVIDARERSILTGPYLRSHNLAAVTLHTADLPMSYPGPNRSAKEILLQAKHLISRPNTTRRSENDEEERQHLVPQEHPPPQCLHRLAPLPRLDVGSSPTLALDDVTLLNRYFLIAQEILSSLQFFTRSLGKDDLRLVGGPPIAAGRFADVRKATHEGRTAALKEYRCYRSFDLNQVATVRCGCLFRVHC